MYSSFTKTLGSVSKVIGGSSGGKLSSGGGILSSSSLSNALKSLSTPENKKILKDFTSSVKTAAVEQAKNAAAQYVQNKLSIPAPASVPPMAVAPVEPSVAAAVPPPTAKQPSYAQVLGQNLVKNIVKASLTNEAASNLNLNLAPKQTEILPGISLKPGVTTETIIPSSSGVVTHVDFKNTALKPFYKKTWFIFVVIAVVIIILAAIALTIYLVIRARNKKKEEEAAAALKK